MNDQFLKATSILVDIDIQNWTADRSGGDRDTCRVRGR